MRGVRDEKVVHFVCLGGKLARHDGFRLARIANHQRDARRARQPPQRVEQHDARGFDETLALWPSGASDIHVQIVRPAKDDEVYASIGHPLHVTRHDPRVVGVVIAEFRRAPGPVRRRRPMPIPVLVPERIGDPDPSFAWRTRRHQVPRGPHCRRHGQAGRGSEQPSSVDDWDEAANWHRLA